MSFTILAAAPTLLVLMIIFGLTYKLKGLKTAFIATGVAFAVFAALYMAMIYVIVSSM